MIRLLLLVCWLPAACLVSPTSERHCDVATPCPSGHSCLNAVCIADGSQNEGEACTTSHQCDGFPQVSCSEWSNTCRRVCSQFLAADPICDASQYCRPERVSSLTAEWTGVCAGSQCQDEFDCLARDVSNVCMPVSTRAGACLEPCEVRVSSGVYTDTCGVKGGLVRSCQPVGLQGRESLACVPRLIDDLLAGDAGDSCDLYDSPCRIGLACVGEAGQQHCRAYCDPAQTNTACPQVLAPYCCAVRSLATELYHVCLSDPCE